MQKEQLIAIITVLIIGLLGSLYLALDPFSDEKEIIQILEPPVNSPTAKDIKETIKTLGKQSWSKSEYENIDSKIRTSHANDLIDATENTSLVEFLNLSYIQTLNKAAKNFFSSARSENGLSSTYNELKRYNSTSYRADIIEMKNVCDSYYGLKKLQSKISSFDYFYNGGENQIQGYFNQLEGFGRKSYLSNSFLVSDIINKSKNSLKTKMSSAIIAELRPKVEDYTTLQEQTDAVTNAFKQQLSELEQNRFLSGNSSINSFVSNALNSLNSHEEVALQMGNIRFNTKSCEEICGRHTYYIAICNEKKGNNQQNIKKEEQEESIDTTGY